VPDDEPRLVQEIIRLVTEYGRYGYRRITGLLMLGYYEGMGHLLGKYNLTTVPVDENLTVFSEQYNELDSIKALVIPSGGLRGKEYDGNFWQKLNSYVSNGGNLVVMDQPFGSLYSRLPGNPQARGWEEDLSCTGWFTRLASGLPASSGQRWITNSYPTDGYFTWLPEQSQIITRRQLRGGAASTVVYPYGQGKVTLTTCYTDFGVGHGQWHLEGGHMIRDLVRCGLNPDPAGEMTEYHSQDTVNLTVAVKYRLQEGSLPANKGILMAIRSTACL
jgi:hypothetical protein